MIARRLWKWIGVCVLLCSCGDEPGKGWVGGSLTIPQCGDDDAAQAYTCEDTTPIDECRAFDLNVDFYSLQVYADGGAQLRLQRGGADAATTDSLLIEVRDVRALRGALNTSLPVGKGQNIRAGLVLFRLCPETTVNLELTGTIVFSRFGADRGDRITGRIEGLEVRDGRSGDAGTVLGLLRGEFDFIRRAGPPYERFQM